MKKVEKLMILLLCVTAVSFGTVSCESKASKEAREAAIRIEAEQRVQAELEAEKDAEQERIAAEKRAEEERMKNTDPYMKKGWNFLLGRLKSPSSASLVGYIPPTDEATRGIARELDMKGLEIAVFNVDAQNSFGTMIRSRYYVFYRNSVPKVVMDGDDFESYIVQFNGTNLVYEALSYAGYFD